MKKPLAAGVATLVAAGAIAVPALAASSKTVQVKDNKFVANKITVRKGTTVKWIWKGDAPHNVTVTRGPAKFHTGNRTSGSFSKKLTRAGTYTILCTIHAPGMKMTITVK
ncbi:cupredoxin domain-containing protein [Conexibacter woesei]|uniref:cupredoxin domain-containing protein n=1 Tax=Conexibacter woesei TaxID=191495 RepID=UPI000411100A|nr:plastocyanin/azurin family copper-binding protein [Conexibacter woesei]